MSENKLRIRQGYRKLSSDRQTDTTEIITTAASWVLMTDRRSAC